MVILSREMPQLTILNAIGKGVYWTSVVFLPLFGLHADLYSENAGKWAGVMAICAHCILMYSLYAIFPGLNAIIITFIAVLELSILAILFLRLRAKVNGHH